MLDGDERAFDEFFTVYSPRLFRFSLRRLNSEDEAEDVVQKTLATAFRKLSTWRGEAALFTWLCTICRHEISAHWQRAGRRPERSLADDVPEIRAALEAMARDAGNPYQQLVQRDLAERVHLALDYLPHPYGDVLEWKYIRGLSVQEIGVRLNSTPKAVESMLSRARDAFREGFPLLAPSNEQEL
jgi:RNA polymerase sigma-70 factor, ECF subfamily